MSAPNENTKDELFAYVLPGGLLAASPVLLRTIKEHSIDMAPPAPLFLPFSPFGLKVIEIRSPLRPSPPPPPPPVSWLDKVLRLQEAIPSVITNTVRAFAILMVLAMVVR